MTKARWYAPLLALVLASAANASDQLDAIGYVEGEWTMRVAFFEDGKWGAPAEPVRAVAQGVLDGAFIRMNTPVAFPGTTFQFEMTLSYDQFNHAYRLVFLDDVNGFMDIYAGQLENEILTVSNANTGTTFPDGQGGVVIGKLVFEKTHPGFQLNAYTSGSEDGPFDPYMAMVFSPAAKTPTP